MPPRTADELRAAFLDFFAARGHTVVAVGEPDPARRHPAVHERGDGAVQAVLRRRRDAAVPARDVDSEVRARGRQAQRPRRRRPHQPALHVLRDARQLQLRRLLQARRDPLGMGALHRGPRARPRAPLGHRPHHRRRSRARSGATWSASLPSGSSASATTTSGAWPTPARAARARRSSGTSGPELGAGGPARPRTRTATSRSGTSCSCSSTPQPDGELVPLPEPSVDTGAGLERNLAVLQGAESVWDIDVFRPLIAAAEARHRRRLRRLPGHRPRRLAAHPRRARPHDDVPRRRRCGAVERGARLRAAPHHPPRGAPRVPARRRRARHAGARRRDGRRRWAARTPTS